MPALINAPKEFTRKFELVTYIDHNPMHTSGFSDSCFAGKSQKSVVVIPVFETWQVYAVDMAIDRYCTAFLVLRVGWVVTQKGPFLQHNFSRSLAGMHEHWARCRRAISGFIVIVFSCDDVDNSRENDVRSMFPNDVLDFSGEIWK